MNRNSSPPSAIHTKRTATTKFSRSFIANGDIGNCTEIFSYWPISATTAARTQQHRQIKQSSQKFAKELQKIQTSSNVTPEIKKLSQDFLKAIEHMNKPDVDAAKALQKMNEMNQQLKSLDEQMKKQEKHAFEI